MRGYKSSFKKQKYKIYSGGPIATLFEHSSKPYLKKHGYKHLEMQLWTHGYRLVVKNAIIR